MAVSFAASGPAGRGGHSRRGMGQVGGVGPVEAAAELREIGRVGAAVHVAGMARAVDVTHPAGQVGPAVTLELLPLSLAGAGLPGPDVDHDELGHLAEPLARGVGELDEPEDVEAVVLAGEHVEV